ncbi:protein phosphatase 2C domain-containing protein [Chondromyces apiculatus]|uniref:Putative phosphatase n=1 Tax=Chondromyces apiculatus DSM 436 TaxID=1192034 RepID=A0A017T4Z7_9BACT|nr:protein phosphatase 2C domain-containing protein [Chondromyces apiculatus]EYF04314.1 putative phosphatase [Chondromyces apiculatus DSM 436]
MPGHAHTTHLKIEFAQASDPGRDPNKQVNEDSCGYQVCRLGHLAVLCDGMGGHQGGREASRTAITTIFEQVEQPAPGTSPAMVLKAAIEEAGRRVYQLGGAPESRGRPGSTVVAMLLHDRGVDVAHVGDSRAFVIRAGQIYPLTRDHSMVQGLLDAGMITEQQAIGHPDANKITRALGMKPEVEVEVRPEPMELYPGDILLMSSDGLTDLALNNDILGCVRQALSSGSLDHACQMLVQMANNRGGHDNITVQMARIVETGSRPMTLPGEPADTVVAAPPSMQGDAVAKTHTGATSHAPPGMTAPEPTAPWGPVLPTEPGALRPTAVDASLAAAHLHAGTPHAAAPHAAAPHAAAPHAAAPHFGASSHASAPAPFLPAQPTITEHERHTSAMGAPPGAPMGHHPAHLDAAPLPYPAPHQNHIAPYPHPTSPHAPAMSRISYGDANAKPSRGGLVFLIISISAVIAVLLILLLWVLLPG